MFWIWYIQVNVLLYKLLLFTVRTFHIYAAIDDDDSYAQVDDKDDDDDDADDDYDNNGYIGKT